MTKKLEGEEWYTKKKKKIDMRKMCLRDLKTVLEVLKQKKH